MWTRDCRLYSLAEEEERSALFRRPPRRSTNTSGSFRRRASAPHAHGHTSSLTSSAASGHGGTSNALSVSGFASNRTSIDTTASSGSVEFLSASNRTTASVGERRHAEVDPVLINTVNNALRQPVAVRDLAGKPRDLVFALRKIVGMDQKLAGMITNSTALKTAPAAKITVNGLSTDFQGKKLVYCLARVSPCRIADTARTVDRPDGDGVSMTGVKCLVGRTRLLEADPHEDLVWDDEFDFPLPIDDVELSALAVHLYVWERRSQYPVELASELRDGPLLFHTEQPANEPLDERDELVGCVSIPLSVFRQYSVPTCQTYSLHAESQSWRASRDSDLTVTVKITNSTSTEQTTFYQMLQTLIHAFWQSAVTMSSNWWQKFDFKPSTMLEADAGIRQLLAQCAAQWHVQAVQLAAMHVMAACQLSEEESTTLASPTVLCLLKNLNKLIHDEQDLEVLEVTSSVSDFHLRLSMLYDTVITGLEDNFRLFPPDKKTPKDAIATQLRILATLSDLREKIGVHNLPGVSDDVEAILENSIIAWYMGDDSLPDDLQRESDEAIIVLLTEMQDLWREAHEILSKVRHATGYNSAFSVIGLSYTGTVIRAMMRVMRQDLESVVATVAQRLAHLESSGDSQNSRSSSAASTHNHKLVDSVALQSFNLYVVTDRFCRKSKTAISKSNVSGVQVVSFFNYHDLFTPCIPRWVGAVQRYVDCRTVSIVKAELDLVRLSAWEETVDSDNISESARDAVDLIEEVINTYWRPIQLWPSCVDAYTGCLGLADVLAGVCRQYTDEVLASLKTIGFFKRNAFGGMEMTTQACAFLCNIDHVRVTGAEKQLLHPIRTVFGSRAAKQLLSPCTSNPPEFPQGHMTLEKQLQGVLDKVVMLLRDDITVKLKKALVEAFKEIQNVFEKDVVEIIKVTHKYSIDLAAQVAQPLLLHSSQLVSQLICCNVPQTAFDCFLECLWGVNISCVHSAVKSRLAKGMSREHCQLACNAVKILHGFFEECTERISLNTAQFKGLMRGLELAQLTTEQLILHYYYLDSQAQETANTGRSDLGTFELRPLLEYRKSKLTLSVNVINCINASILDKASSGDVCLRLELCPRHLFNDSASLFSARINSRADQKFDMKVMFPVPDGSSVAMQNGVLQLTLVHREWWGIFERVLAQAVVPLHDIPGPILGGPDLIQPTERSTTLGLLLPTSHREVVQVLQSRARDDKLATDFLQWHLKKMDGKGSKKGQTPSPSSTEPRIQHTESVDEHDLFE